MAYYDHQRPRYDSHNTSSRDTGGHSRYGRHDFETSTSDQLPTMNSTAYEPRYQADYADYIAPPPPPPPPHARYAAPTPYRTERRSNRAWPPLPSVEGETESLAKEFPLSRTSVGLDEGGEVKSRGSVDQYPIIEEIEQPTIHHDIDERRFVLVSDATADYGSKTTSTTASEQRRKSFAERGNMPYLKTDVTDPPVFTERTSTPYAYTKPQKEAVGPLPAEIFLSPEPATPASSSRPQSVRPSKAIPVHSRYDSFTQSHAQSLKTRRDDVFDDSDLESEDTTHLRTERKPARYSFVKSDLQKEDLRTNLHDTPKKPAQRRQDRPEESRTHGAYSGSSSSSKHTTPPYQSPRSSASSLDDGTRRKVRPGPVDTKLRESRSPTRPSSPRYHEAHVSPQPSPKLPPRRPVDSPTVSRPLSRSGFRPPSPLSSSKTLPPTSAPRVPVTDADWHTTYPPVTNERSRPPSRLGRHESMPVPKPRIDVQSPSPARHSRPENPLPYPVDDRLTDVFMPPEEQYQFDHSSTPVTSTPRQKFPESPKLSASPVSGSPRERPMSFRPSASGRNMTNPEEIPRITRVRSGSLRSQSSHDARRSERRAPIPLSLDRPLPSCPRSEPSDKYDDWYTLENCPNFDVCPSCYEGVFADTPFTVYFSQIRRSQRSVERFCDFSSPWMRLAWLLTIKQRRQSIDLIYALASILNEERPCPKDRELGTDRAIWYGIPDLRDGIHVTNFAVCPCDMKMIEALFPSVRGYFTRLHSNGPLGSPDRYTCSLRTTSRRFPKYLDLLVELDNEASLRGQRPDMSRFIQLARENAFKAECTRDTPSFRKPWHYIPSLPEFTICQECYDELVWPALTSKSSSLPKLVNRTVQLVPGENPDAGSSCCLYSPRMRRLWNRAVEDDDFGYLKKKAVERRKMEVRLGAERRELVGWMAGLERGGREWERAKRGVREVEKDWGMFE